MSIGAELEKDRFKCLEMRELNGTEKFTSQFLFKFVVSQDTFIQIAFSITYVDYFECQAEGFEILSIRLS